MGSAAHTARTRQRATCAPASSVALLAAALLGACSESSPEAQDAASAVDADTSPALSDGGAGLDQDASMSRQDASSATRDAASARDATAAPSADASTSDAGASPTTRPTMCNGKPLPPRALGKSPPFAVGPESAGLPAYWPSAGWRKEDPEKLGFDAAKLMQAAAFSTTNAQTQAVFVVRHGYVAAEVYSRGFTASTQHESYSMAKSVTSGLVGIALAEGKLASLDDRVCNAYPAQWSCSDSADPRSRITIDHALNLITGLDWKEDWRSTATGPNDALGLNLLDVVLGKQSSAEPGQMKRYSTGDPALLSGVLQKGTGMSALQYAKQKIFDVIGTPGIRWNADRAGRTTTYAGMQATASEYAKYGYLYLHGGAWDGKQVVPAEWVERTTRAKQPCDDWNQYLWHVNPPIRLGKQDPACASLYCPPVDIADLPPDGFFAEGVYGQFLFVVPSQDLVVVRLAQDTGGLEHWEEIGRGFLGAVLSAIR